MPTGCGEQNMIGLVPNIYLLNYLNGTNQKNKELERKAKEPRIKTVHQAHSELEVLTEKRQATERDIQLSKDRIASHK